MNYIGQMERTHSVARAIKFKEYLLLRDVSSRRIIIEHCIEMMKDCPAAVAWLKNLRSINDQIDSKERKEQIKTDAFWDDLILVHSKDPRVNSVMGWFLGWG